MPSSSFFLLQLHGIHPSNQPVEHLCKVEFCCDGRLLAEHGVMHCGRGSPWVTGLPLHEGSRYSKDSKICDAFLMGKSGCIFGRDLFRGRRCVDYAYRNVSFAYQVICKCLCSFSRLPWRQNTRTECIYIQWTEGNELPAWPSDQPTRLKHYGHLYDQTNKVLRSPYHIIDIFLMSSLRHSTFPTHCRLPPPCIVGRCRRRLSFRSL